MGPAATRRRRRCSGRRASPTCATTPSSFTKRSWACASGPTSPFAGPRWTSARSASVFRPSRPMSRTNVTRSGASTCADASSSRASESRASAMVVTSDAAAVSASTERICRPTTGRMRSGVERGRPGAVVGGAEVRVCVAQPGEVGALVHGLDGHRRPQRLQAVDAGDGFLARFRELQRGEREPDDDERASEPDEDAGAPRPRAPGPAPANDRPPPFLRPFDCVHSSAPPRSPPVARAAR